MTASPAWEAECYLAAEAACRMGYELAAWLEDRLRERRESAQGDADFCSISAVVEYADREIADIDAKLPVIAHCRSMLNKPERNSETVLRYLAIRTLQGLAQPFAGAPGYRTEWEPK